MLNFHQETYSEVEVLYFLLFQYVFTVIMLDNVRQKALKDDCGWCDIIIALDQACS